MSRLGCITLCLIFSICFVTSPTRAELSLKVAGDSLWFGSGIDRIGLPMNLFTGNDTLRIAEDTAIWLSSRIDSVLVVKSSRYVPVTLSFVGSAQPVVFFFDSFQDQLRDRLALLRKYSNFGTTSVTTGVTFSYSAPTDTGLSALRIKYELDRVAGGGSEISRMLKLLRWAHRIVRHDGNSPNPVGLNALNLIKVCADSNRGVNCRMLATILNEACLSMGFKSRHLTCLPFDKSDQDCHVVNMVWSDSLGKWIYLDPTFNGFFQDTAGRMLSPQEIRMALINGDSLLINPELDYNGQAHSPLEYRAYMAKNLFRFSTPLESAFNYESRSGNRAWVNLNPLGYDSTLVGTSDTTKSGEKQRINYYCDDISWFFGN